MNRETIRQKVEALLGQMTLEEKVAQMVQVPYAMVGREEAIQWARRGAGSFLHVLGDDAREIQQEALNTRLGIPVIFGIDAIHGHGLNDHATIFPSQLATACSWDPAVAEEVGRVTAREVATDGLHWTFSPVLCLGRDTRWGRIDETFGEDPYLTGEMGAAIIRGYQGDDLAGDESILACAKHYLAYGEATGGRDAYDSEITYRKMREVMLPPFRKAAEAGCATMMTAYGSIDGKSITADPYVLRDILRDELGFDGFLVTDWDNAKSLMTRQHVAENLPEACTMAAEAGNDMIMTTLEFYEGALDAVRSGRMKESVIDDAVRHILTVKFRMNLFEKPEKKGRPGCFACQEHLDAALHGARRSVTLLRNNGVLPLKDGVRTVAVIGPNADNIRNQYGDWAYFTHPHPNLDHEPVRPYVTVKEGMEQLCARHGLTCLYHQGCSIKPAETDDIPGAVQTAQQADAVVLVLGDEISQIGEGKDRADLALSGQQMALFSALKQTGKPIITVLVSSKPLGLGESATEADAFLCAFNGGMFGGQAVAEVIFGEIEPCGRLPITFPHHSGQLPVYYSQLPGWHNGKYCDLPAEPLFSFGEGLGYTDFAYAGLTMDAETFTAAVDVTNTGSRPGTETVQVYFRDVVSSVITPVKRLIAFRQITLQPGETRHVIFQLKKDDFALVDRQERTVVEPGAFILYVGHSSKDADLLNTTFRI